jgi:hypothetical protein
VTHLRPDQFHLVYVNPKLLRLLVYAPGYSTFFEVRADEQALPTFQEALQAAGYALPEEEFEEALQVL